ncbi:hypothetical protein EK904_010425 [Melospiza melodia maxima]|nr:hypothetical protein EK904_010425 [Melospiza melodia maxima]
MLLSVGSTESTDARLTCIFAFWVRRKKKMTHAQEHTYTSIYKQLVQTKAGFSWYTGKFGSPTEGSSSMDEDFGEPEDLVEKAHVTHLQPPREENKYSQRRGRVIPNMNTMTSPRNAGCDTIADGPTSKV